MEQSHCYIVYYTFVCLFKIITFTYVFDVSILWLISADSCSSLYMSPLSFSVSVSYDRLVQMHVLIYLYFCTSNSLFDVFAIEVLNK